MFPFLVYFCLSYVSLILNNTKVNKQITWTFPLKAANLFIERIIHHLNFVFVIRHSISFFFKVFHVGMSCSLEFGHGDAYNPSTQQAKAGPVASSTSPTLAIEWIQGQPGLYRKTLTRKIKTANEHTHTHVQNQNNQLLFHDDLI